MTEIKDNRTQIRPKDITTKEEKSAFLGNFQEMFGSVGKSNGQIFFTSNGKVEMTDYTCIYYSDNADGSVSATNHSLIYRDYMRNIIRMSGDADRLDRYSSKAVAEIMRELKSAREVYQSLDDYYDKAMKSILRTKVDALANQLNDFTDSMEYTM